MPVRVCDDDPNHIGDYTLEERLGDGTYGTVFVATHAKKKERFAVKRIDFNLHPEQLRATEKQVAREATIMQGLQHAHVVKLIKVMQSNDAFYFVMELAEGGELLDKMAGAAFDESTSRRYFQQLVSAIHYCHCKNVVHRDLKAENLLLTKNSVLKVCDFGFSCRLFDNPDYDDEAAETRSDCSMGNLMSMEASGFIGHPSSGFLADHTNFPAPSTSSNPPPSGSSGQAPDPHDTAGLSETTSNYDDGGFVGFNDEVGTVGYMPPEMLGMRNPRQKDKVDPRAHDLWAAGVILYFMLVGEHPFEGHDEEETVYNILNNNIDFSRVNSEGPRRILEEMLSPDPQLRLSLQDIIDTAWFQQDLDDSLFPESFLANVKKRQHCRSFLDFKRSPSSSTLNGMVTDVHVNTNHATRASVVSAQGGSSNTAATTPSGLKSNRGSFADLSYASGGGGAFHNGVTSRSASVFDPHSVGPHTHHGLPHTTHGYFHQGNHHHQNGDPHFGHHFCSRASRTSSTCDFNNTPTLEEQRVIRKAFNAIDVDGYGAFVTWAQLRDVVMLLKGKRCMVTPPSAGGDPAVKASTFPKVPISRSVTPVDCGLPGLTKGTTTRSPATSTEVGVGVVSEGLRWLQLLLDLFDSDVRGVVTFEDFQRAWTEGHLGHLPKGLEAFNLKVIAECRSAGFVPPKASHMKHAPSSGSAGKSPTSPVPTNASSMTVEFASSGAGSVDGRRLKTSSFAGVHGILPVAFTGGTSPLPVSPVVFVVAKTAGNLPTKEGMGALQSSRKSIDAMAASTSGTVSPVSSPTATHPASTPSAAPATETFPIVPSVDDLAATTTTTNSEPPSAVDITMPPTAQALMQLGHPDSPTRHGSSLTTATKRSVANASTCATTGCTPTESGWGSGRSTPPFNLPSHLTLGVSGGSPHQPQPHATSPLTGNSPTVFKPVLSFLPRLEPLHLIPQHLEEGDGRALVRQVRKVFDTMDTDGDGLVFAADLMHLFRDAGMQGDVTADEVKHLVQHLDGSSAGDCFSFDEFLSGATRRAFMASHPLGKRFAQASGLGKSFGLCGGGKSTTPEPTSVATAKFTVVGIPIDVLERISTYSPDRLCLRRQSSDLHHHHPHHRDPCSPRPNGGSPLSNSVTPFSLSGSCRSIPTLPSEPLVATFRFKGGHSPQSDDPPSSVHVSPSSETQRCGLSPLRPPTSPEREGGAIDHSPHRSRECSFRSTPMHGAGPTRRLDSCTLYSISPDPGHSHPTTTNSTFARSEPHPCELDIKIHTASHNGYTSVRMSQKSGTARDFHDAVEVIAQSLEAMRDQAVNDSCTKGESELM